ncbi:MAG: FKBP-type peptidyl-prolyl cis-trans isomerase [Moraxellaceae bacterium]|jgi:FKBP-type peptidyl-prolyl cis-trans isomerase|nr:FKBP-type peptidyl-prolyl cis-trans isomerase [Moraxellaceae bacterium]
MKRTLLAATLLASLPVLAAEPGKAASPYAKEDDKAAYSIGYLSGKAHSQHIETLNLDAFVAGFRDAYAKKDAAIPEDEMRATLESFKQRMSAEAAAKAQKEAQVNKKKGSDFLAANAKKKGVKTTKSGVQYEVLTQGKGPKPKDTDVVKVHYSGTLIDGTVFDSSVARGEPATFQLNQVIPGWTEALQLMPVGSKYRIALPPEQGYGEMANGPIPANSVLVFEVELLGIEAPGSTEGAAPAP